MLYFIHSITARPCSRRSEWVQSWFREARKQGRAHVLGVTQQTHVTVRARRFPAIHCPGATREADTIMLLTRGDVALHASGRQWISLQCHQATSIEICFRGHKCDEAQHGPVIVRTRDDAGRARSLVGACGGVVALMVELMSSFPAAPESAPLLWYRHGNGDAVRGYTETLGPPR
ncbi:unnamed protein product [Laminaria digitata]